MIWELKGLGWRRFTRVVAGSIWAQTATHPIFSNVIMAKGMTSARLLSRVIRRNFIHLQMNEVIQ